MLRKMALVLGLLGALMLPSETFAKHGGGHGHGHGGHGARHWHAGSQVMVTVAIGMAARPIGTATAIGMGAIGMVAIGMDVAIGIGGMVGGGLTVLALVGE